jgi:DNA-binding response OmpR family regulator
MYNINILIAEDEERLRKLISKYLKIEGYIVYEASDGKEALDIFESHQIDLIILDVMMPEINGWMVCKRVRRVSNIPIIMLTAYSEEEDKLFGFDLGVDDYITKPFSTRELIARTKALLKRSGKTGIEGEISIGSIKINTSSRKVEVNNEEIRLSPKEYDVLMFFVDNGEIALTREQIITRIWGYDYYGDNRTVDTTIKRLRKKLNEEGNRIQTIRGVGYRFEVK